MGAASHGIPVAIGDLTPGWLGGALAARGLLGAARLESVTAESLGAGAGYTGQVARLRLEVAGDAEGVPRSLIAKLPSGDPEMRAGAELAGAYEREIRFYEELAPSVPIRVPRCYFAAMDAGPEPGGDARLAPLLGRLPPRVLGAVLAGGRRIARRRARRYVLLVEDLAPARPGDQVAGCSLERAADVLRALAALHAAFWGSRSLAGRAWLASADRFSRVGHQFFRLERPAFERLYGHALPVHLRRLLDWLERRGPALHRAIERSPFTLLHGDARLDNLFFDDAGVALVDWQALSRGPALHDVAYFLGATLAPAAGRDDEADLVRAYHEALLAGGVRGYSLEACRRDYERARLLALARLASAGDAIEFGESERGRALIEGWIERLGARLERVDPDAVLALP